MLVVSNTSPLLNLSITGRLDLIRDQFVQVKVAPSVLSELRAEEPLPGSAALKTAIDSGWIQAIDVAPDPLLKSLGRDLHRREAETIALAECGEKPE